MSIQFKFFRDEYALKSSSQLDYMLFDWKAQWKRHNPDILATFLSR
jgi:hypothetical protein